MSQSKTGINVTLPHGESPEEELVNVIESEVFIFLEVFIAVFAFTNNLLVLIAIWRFPRLRSPTNYFVASLAVADIAVAIFAIPSAILLRLGLSVYHHECDVVEGPSVGEALCLILVTSVLFLTQVSIYSLFMIAVDRFIAIHYPYRYNRFMTATKTKVAIVSAWSLSGLVIIAPLLSWSQWSKLSACEKNKCRFEEIVSKEYMVYFNFFACVLPALLAMCIMYFNIFWSAKKQLAKIYADVSKSKKKSKRRSPSEVKEASKTELTSFTGIETYTHYSDAFMEEEARSLGSPSPIAATAKIVAAINKSPQLLRQFSKSPGHGHPDLEEEQLRRTKLKRKKARLRRELHAAKSLATVVGMFAICWLPIHLLHTVTLFCRICKEHFIVLDITILLSHANSLVNPIIYAHRLTDFRNAFRKIFAPMSSKLSKNCSIEQGFGKTICPCLQEPSPGPTPEISNDETT